MSKEQDTSWEKYMLRKVDGSPVLIRDAIWELSTGKKTYSISGQQAKAIMDMIKTGARFISLDKVYLSVGHIVSIEEVEPELIEDDPLQIMLFKQQNENTKSLEE